MAIQQSKSRQQLIDLGSAILRSLDTASKVRPPIHDRSMRYLRRSQRGLFFS